MSISITANFTCKGRQGHKCEDTAQGVATLVAGHDGVLALEVEDPPGWYDERCPTCCAWVSEQAKAFGAEVQRQNDIKAAALQSAREKLTPEERKALGIY